MTEESDEQDARSTLLETPTRWPYRIEGLFTGMPISYLIAKAYNLELLLILGGIGMLVIIAMQYGGVTK